MTTLVTADIHLSDNPRDDYRHKFMERLPDIIEECGASRLLILGDLTEEKDRHAAQLVNSIVDYINTLSKICPVYIIRGNHDYLAEEHPYYEFVSKLKNVRWYNEPHIRMLKGLGNCYFLPHTANYKRDWDGIDFPDCDWIFAHQTFDGAIGEHGHKLDGIPRTIFGRNAKVIAGDIHVPQTIKPVTYVGAPYLVDFGDSYKPRMLLLNKNSMKSIPCYGPQKRLVEIKDVADLKSVKGLGEGDILKVRVELDSKQADKRYQIQADIRAWGVDKGYRVHTIQIAISGAASASIKRSKASRRSDEQLVKDYAKKQGAKGSFIKAGIRLMEKE